MDLRKSEWFKNEVHRAFGFLVTDHQFLGPVTKNDLRIGWAYVQYRKANIGLECMLDERESDVSCEVFQIVSGQVPPSFETTEMGLDFIVRPRAYGRLVRDYLETQIRLRGARSALFRETSGLPFEEHVASVLDDYASMLRRYGADFLRDLPNALIDDPRDLKSQ